MQVTVETQPTHVDQVAGAVHTYDDSAGWHIDEERQLHVKKDGGGNLAAYAVGTWRSVRETE